MKKWVQVKHTGILVYRNYRCVDCNFESPVNHLGEIIINDHSRPIKAISYHYNEYKPTEIFVIPCPKCKCERIRIGGSGYSATYFMDKGAEKEKE